MSGPHPRIPEHLVDAYFDRALGEGSRDKLFRAMLADPVQAEELARTQRAIALLREPVESPDLTERIMGRVHQRRRFLPHRLRRVVTAGRLAVAACVLVGILGVAVVRRVAPQAFDLTPRPRPIAAVIEAGREAAANGELAGAVTAVTEQAEPVVNFSRRVLAEVGTATPAQEQVYIAALTPGQLPGIRTLPPRRSTTLVVMGGSGTMFGAPLPDPHEIYQESGGRFPVASIVRLVGGRWAGPGDAAHPVDPSLIMPGFQPDHAGILGSPSQKTAEDRSGGASPPK